MIKLLLYHDFCEDEYEPTYIYTTRRSRFIRQMKYLRDNGYKSISFNDLFYLSQNHKPLPDKAVIITLDGPYHSWIDIAIPVLKEFDFKATFFIVTNWVIDYRQKINWIDLRAISNYIDQRGDKLFSFESHTVTHSLLERSFAESEKNLLQRLSFELNESKNILDRELGQRTQVIALPQGKGNNNELWNMARDFGYKAIRTAEIGKVQIKIFNLSYVDLFGSPFWLFKLCLSRFSSFYLSLIIIKGLFYFMIRKRKAYGL